MNQKSLILALGFASCATFASAQLVNDTTDFSNWYKAETSAGSTLNKAGSSLVWTPGAGSNGEELIGRSFSSTTLSVGDTLTASLTMVQSPIVTIFRIGLGDSTAAFSADDWLNTTDDYDGYYTFAFTNGADGGARSENGSFPNEPTGGLSQSTFTTGGQTSDAFTSTAPTYDINYSITYTSLTQMDTLLTIVDTSDSSTKVSIAGSTSTIYNSFDTLLLRADTGTQTFDNITVAIPEPSSLALMAVALGGFFLVRGRRR